MDTEQGQAQEETGVTGISAELYGQLRRLAHYHLRSQQGDITLNCTALVHEAFLKLSSSQSDVPDSANEYAVLASLAMRQILVDYVRKKNAQKHGGMALHVTFHEALVEGASSPVDLIDLDTALSRLGEKDEQLERITLLRFFAGMTVAEIAKTLDRSHRSVERDWARARVYLNRELESLHA